MTQEYQDWILEIIDKTVQVFYQEFKYLWKNERSGILYPKVLFEDQGHDSTEALNHVLRETWKDAVTICGIEMHRRCLSLAHNADFEDIADLNLRAKLEARNLLAGRELVLNASSLVDIKSVLKIAKTYNKKDLL